jgi:predicted Zn-dependent peptidase
VAELINEKSKKALATLSEMISKNTFDYEAFERIRKYAEEANDERVKDMLNIVQKRFRKTPDSKEHDVSIQVIE